MNLQKANAQIKNITTLKTQDSKTLTKPTDIRNEGTRFSKDLYTNNQTFGRNKIVDPERHFLDTPIIKQMQETERAELDQDSTVNEMCNAIKNLPNGKSPRRMVTQLNSISSPVKKNKTQLPIV